MIFFFYANEPLNCSFTGDISIKKKKNAKNKSFSYIRNDLSVYTNKIYCSTHTIQIMGSYRWIFTKYMTYIVYFQMPKNAKITKNSVFFLFEQKLNISFHQISFKGNIIQSRLSWSGFLQIFMRNFTSFD